MITAVKMIDGQWISTKETIAGKVIDSMSFYQDDNETIIILWGTEGTKIGELNYRNVLVVLMDQE